jgi:microcystin degradation protein MlrC
MVDAVNALVVYKTNPHVDQLERGLQATSILSEAMRGETKPVQVLKKPNVLFNIVFHNTNNPPMAALMESAIAAEQEEGILACSIAAGFQYADVPAMGPSVVVCADRDTALAKKTAERIGNQMWNVRNQLMPDLLSPHEAVARARRTSRPPVALFEIGDNIGGGSSGDSTFILSELIDQQADGWVVALFDPGAVDHCARAGVGSTVSLPVGGKTDDQHGPTLCVSGRVLGLHCGEYEERDRRHGGQRHHNQGLTAVLEVPSPSGNASSRLVLNSRRTTPFSINQLRSVGIIPEYQRILVAKGTVAPRAAYEPVCSEIIVVDTGGATSVSRLSNEFVHARKGFHEWVSAAEPADRREAHADGSF